MSVPRPTGELQNQSLNQVELKKTKELSLSMEEQQQTAFSQTSPGPEQMFVQNPGTPGLEKPHSGLCHQQDSGSAVLPFSALLTGVARFSLLCESEEEVNLPRIRWCQHPSLDQTLISNFVFITWGSFFS